MKKGFKGLGGPNAGCLLAVLTDPRKDSKRKEELGRDELARGQKIPLPKSVRRRRERTACTTLEGIKSAAWHCVLRTSSKEKGGWMKRKTGKWEGKYLAGNRSMWRRQALRNVFGLVYSSLKRLGNQVTEGKDEWKKSRRWAEEGDPRNTAAGSYWGSSPWAYTKGKKRSNKSIKILSAGAKDNRFKKRGWT